MNNQHFKIAVIVLLTVIIAWGFFLRVFDIGKPSLWIDEGFTIMQVRAISDHGYPLLASGIKDFKDPFLPYFLAIFKPFTGESIFFYRLIMVLFGTGSIIVAFLIGKKLANRIIGLMFSFFIAFSYWHVAWSREIRGYSTLVFFTLLTILFIVLENKRDKGKYLVFALIACILAAASKTAGILLLPSIFLYLLLKKRYKKFTLFSAIILAIAFGFLILFRNVFHLSLYNYSGFYFWTYFWSYFGFTLPIALAGIAIAFYYDRKNLPVHAFLLFFFIISFSLFSFFVYVNQRRYLFFLTPILYLYVSYFIYYLAYHLKYTKILSLVFFTAFIVADIFYLQSMFFIPRTNFPLEFYVPKPDFNEIYGTIKDKKSDNKFVTISPYPYLDLIYLGKADYAIPISYTGRPDETSISSEHKEYYSGVPDVLSVNKIMELQKDSDVYFILDDMARNRIEERIYNFIRYNAELIRKTRAAEGQSAYLYKLEKKDLIELSEDEQVYPEEDEAVEESEKESLPQEFFENDDPNNALYENSNQLKIP